MNTVLITGGAGFIGSHLCDKFINEGHDVICVDNFLSGSRDNIKHLINNPHFTLVEHDITEPFLPENFNLKLDKLSAILHFACPASPNPASPVSYMAHPVETMMVTSFGTKNMLDLAKKNNCQIILASTSEVYGDPEVHPQAEAYRGNVSCTGVRACYDEGKRFMEALAMVYYREFQVKAKIIRIFNTYGPRMRLDDGRFTIELVNCYLNHQPFILYGKGDATRSFCYIDDLVEGIFQMYAHDIVGEPVNLGNPVEFVLRDAISTFEQVAGARLEIKREAAQQDDPKRRQPDITKAKQLLNWEPKIDFATGIRHTLNYYRQQLKIEN